MKPFLFTSIFLILFTSCVCRKKTARHSNHSIDYLEVICINKKKLNNDIELTFEFNKFLFKAYTCEGSALSRSFKKGIKIKINKFDRSISQNKKRCYSSQWATLAKKDYSIPKDQLITTLGEFGCVPRLIYGSNNKVLNYPLSGGNYFEIPLAVAHGPGSIIPELREQYFVTNQKGIDKLNSYLQTNPEEIELGIDVLNLSSVIVYRKKVKLSNLIKNEQ